MKHLLVYVSAPVEDGAFVRDAVHDRLREHDLQPTSRWVEAAQGKDDFARFAPTQLRQAAAQNDADVRGSDVVLALPRAGAGGEMFAEVRVALEWQKAVVWVGSRRTLSAWRSGVVLVDDLAAAIVALCAMRDRRAEGYRGQLLAHLAGSAA